MLYLLFIFILLLLLFTFFLFHKNILNPSVILCASFLFSLFFAILNIERWNIMISMKTFLIIIGSISAFIIGNSIVLFIPRKRDYKGSGSLKKIKRIPFKIIMGISLILLFFLFQYFKATYNLSVIVGNFSGYSTMIKYARIARLNFYTVGSLNTLKLYLAMSISYITLFNFLYIIVYKKFRLKIIYLLFPTIIYLGFCILSTGRTGIIWLFIYAIVMFIILYQKRNGIGTKTIKKMLFYTFLITILFLGIFILIGLLVRKQNKTIFDFLSVYIGSPIPAFDKYLKLNLLIENRYFGEHTLFKVYNVLRNLGYNIPKLYAPYERVALTTEITPNIYGAIRRYYDDFSYIGLFIILYLLGFFYGLFFQYIYYRKEVFFSTILYATFSYPIFEFPIEERFFMELFPTGFIREILFLGLTYYFLIFKISFKNKDNDKKLKKNLYKE